MRTLNFVVFFSIVLAVYVLVNYYIFIRGWQSIPSNSLLRSYYLAAFLILSLSFILSRILEQVWDSRFHDIFAWIGSFWLAAMLYFFLIIVLLDLSRLINHLLPFFPAYMMADYGRTKQVIALTAIGVVALILVAGHINALHPRLLILPLSIPKATVGPKVVNIVVASDIHLGTIIGRSRVMRLVERINQLNPDLVILPGDVLDEDLGPVIRQNLGETLRNIRAPWGVIAVTGNHEYIGGVERACQYLGEHDILVLRDSVLKVKDSFYIVGREDREISRFTGRTRKPLEELMGGVDSNYPVILLDHQPLHLEQAVANRVDLQISGHTHHGQLWPFNFITKMIYEKSWGYKKIGNTHVYVSSGLGTWGPPVRIGNRPEIVSIKLSFQ